ncbi:ABC transporter ATP-binding protein [Bacillus sp. FJAT-27251]|uniref:ABC transporter ATP-binding protein n=1 Tax=Bacillus sp. FJAT-27251 TaxID=1684142 RepID=UPI000AD423A1|nr:ABC transporter ATP-binding protein [Bacillus sp. FJAT-27251]
MLKGIIEKFFKPAQVANEKTYSQSEIEALVDAKVKEHTASLQSSLAEQASASQVEIEEDYTLSAKQIDYALSLIEKLNREFELAIEPSQLTIKDLNRLIAYQRYKNKGTLINLVKKGVLRRK